jgi:hypothetical protein
MIATNNFKEIPQVRESSAPLAATKTKSPFANTLGINTDASLNQSQPLYGTQPQGRSTAESRPEVSGTGTGKRGGQRGAEGKGELFPMYNYSGMDSDIDSVGNGSNDDGNTRASNSVNISPSMGESGKGQNRQPESRESRSGGGTNRKSPEPSVGMYRTIVPVSLRAPAEGQFRKEFSKDHPVSIFLASFHYSQAKLMHRLLLLRYRTVCRWIRDILQGEGKGSASRGCCFGQGYPHGQRQNRTTNLRCAGDGCGSAETSREHSTRAK